MTSPWAKSLRAAPVFFKDMTWAECAAANLFLAVTARSMYCLRSLHRLTVSSFSIFDCVQPIAISGESNHRPNTQKGNAAWKKAEIGEEIGGFMDADQLFALFPPLFFFPVERIKIGMSVKTKQRRAQETTTLEWNKAVKKEVE